MAFLDNSGDIILDAVLTDEGRKRLAKGNGSFNISRFALGDDEIDYSLYNSNHPSGSAYYDLEILQTPILEAMTSAQVGLKHALVTALNERKFYMPVLRLNTKEETTALKSVTGSFIVPVSKASRDKFTGRGILDGFSPKDGSKFIRFDQGLDTAFEVPADSPLDRDDRETQYKIMMDNRLGELTDKNGAAVPKSFVDENNVATYYATLQGPMVNLNTNTEQSPGTEVIEGPRGTRAEFKVKSTLQTRQSNYLFNKIGGTDSMLDKDNSKQKVRFIDSTIKVEGVTTGASLNIPVRYVKEQSE